MKTAIIYSTTHGTTEKVALMIKDYDIWNTELFNLKSARNIDLKGYDRIILGGSIHAGNIQKRVRDFYTRHMDELTSKPLGLYLSCMDEEKAQAQFDNAFPEALRSHATSKKLTGGEVQFERMNFIEKFLMRKIGKVTVSSSNIKHDRVVELVEEMGIKQ